MTNMSVEDEKKRDAEKCLQIAEGAFSGGDYKKAERLLLKAERLYPTTLAKQMLKDIRNANGEDSPSASSDDTDRSTSDGGYNSESSSTTFSGEYHRSEEDKKASELCVEIGKSSISKGNFDKAKNFLLKSQRLYPNDESKELLNKLDDLKKNYSSTNYNVSCPSVLENKDEAEKCIQIAETEFAASRLARAERLLHKAERLYTMTRAKDLLRQIENARASGVKDTEEGKTGQHRPKQSRSEGKQKPNPENERPKRNEPTPEQIEVVRRVKQANDDCEILGVQKQCSVSDVKKAFRKLTLRLHPDKNKAPGAKEAFMLASEASERLTKQKSRLTI